MDGEIPKIVELLYLGLIPGPNPQFWPERLRDDPVKGHSLWTFYRGLEIGFQLAAACMNDR